MAIKFIDDSILSDIADAIRSKLSVATTYKPSQMATAISSISGGNDWVDVTPDLSNVVNRSGVAHTYDASTDTLRLYTTSNAAYRSATLPFTVEVNTMYRFEFDLINAKTAYTYVTFHNSSSDKIIYGGALQPSGHYTDGTIVSDCPNFTTVSDCQLAFYCTGSSSSAGDATWKNFRVYKYVGGNS